MEMGGRLRESPEGNKTDLPVEPAKLVARLVKTLGILPFRMILPVRN